MHTIAIICAMQVELEAIKSLVESIEKINIGPQLREQFKDQIKRDAQLLEDEEQPDEEIE